MRTTEESEKHHAEWRRIIDESRALCLKFGTDGLKYRMIGGLAEQVATLREQIARMRKGTDEQVVTTLAETEAERQHVASMKGMWAPFNTDA